MTYDSTVLADSPWFYGKTDEASGSLLDSSGNSRTMIMGGGAPTYQQAGPSGASDAITWPDSSGATEYYATTTVSVGASNIKTFECWVYLTATPTNPTSLVGCAYGYGNGSPRPEEMYVDTDGKVKLLSSINSSAAPTILAAPSALSLNTWHHVVGVFSSTVVRKIRIDKVDVASDSPTISFSATSSRFYVHGGGVDSTGVVNLINGSAVRISKPALYDGVALTDTRIDAHYDAMPLSGTATGGTGALSLSGSGGAAASTGGTGALALSGSGTAGATAGGSGALDLSATGAVVGPMPAAGTGALSLSASGAVSATADGAGSLTLSGSGLVDGVLPAAGSGSLTLSGTGTAVGPLAAGGTGALDLSGSSSVAATAAGSGSLTFSGVGAALATFLTDLSNVLSGRRRGGLGVVTYEPPFVAPPATIVLASKVDKAVAYPAPTMVNGRPT